MSVLLAPLCTQKQRNELGTFTKYLWDTYGARSSRGVSSEGELE